MADFLRDAPLYSFSWLRQNKGVLPRERGIYGLFFDAAPGCAPVADCQVRDGLRLLYIGTAGADLTKNGHLRNRLGDHHLGGNERRSTICQTLAALMPEIAGACISRLEKERTKFHTSPSGVASLRDWMDKHVSVCWMKHSDPGGLERALIRRYSLPLNVEFNDHHPFAAKLESLRDRRRSMALREDE